MKSLGLIRLMTAKRTGNLEPATGNLLQFQFKPHPMIIHNLYRRIDFQVFA